jgi:hypothetical protein
VRGCGLRCNRSLNLTDGLVRGFDDQRSYGLVEMLDFLDLRVWQLSVGRCCLLQRRCFFFCGRAVAKLAGRHRIDAVRDRSFRGLVLHRLGLLLRRERNGGDRQFLSGCLCSMSLLRLYRSRGRLFTMARERFTRQHKSAVPSGGNLIAGSGRGCDGRCRLILCLFRRLAAGPVLGERFPREHDYRLRFTFGLRRSGGFFQTIKRALRGKSPGSATVAAATSTVTIAIARPLFAAGALRLCFHRRLGFSRNGFRGGFKVVGGLFRSDLGREIV